LARASLLGRFGGGHLAGVLDRDLPAAALAMQARADFWSRFSNLPATCGFLAAVLHNI